MSTPNYGHWIRQAEICRLTAASAASEPLRKRFLGFAARYEALAAAARPRRAAKAASIGDGRPLFFVKRIADPVSDLLIARRANRAESD